MALILTTPPTDPCAPIGFVETFESGNLNNWDYISPPTGGQPYVAQITNSPVYAGSNAVSMLNGSSDAVGTLYPGSPSAGMYKNVSFAQCPTQVNCRFHIVTRGNDDVPIFEVAETVPTLNIIFTFIPAREQPSDGARRMWYQGVPYVTLTVGIWYSLNVTINWGASTTDFEVRDNVGTLVASNTGVAFSGATFFGSIKFSTQFGLELPAGPFSECVYDNIEVLT